MKDTDLWVCGSVMLPNCSEGPFVGVTGRGILLLFRSSAPVSRLPESSDWFVSSSDAVVDGVGEREEADQKK